MDDHLACAELCERHGFDRQAALFRAIAAGRASAFLLVYRAGGFATQFDPEPIGLPASIHLDRDSADREMLGREMERLRDVDRTRWLYTHYMGLPDTEAGPLIWLSGLLGVRYRQSDDFEAELCERLRSASDPEILEIMGRFAVRFFRVAEVPLAIPAPEEVPLGR